MNTTVLPFDKKAGALIGGVYKSSFDILDSW